MQCLRDVPHGDRPPVQDRKVARDQAQLQQGQDKPAEEAVQMELLKSFAPGTPHMLRDDAVFVRRAQRRVEGFRGKLKDHLIWKVNFLWSIFFESLQT